MLAITDLRTPHLGPLSLTVATGECVAVMGPSGSGKSLMLRAIADIDPNTGDVSLGEDDRDRMPADRWRRLVAMVPAESGWWTDRVADHFDPAHDFGPMLDAIDMADALDWPVSRLSSGERHRLAIARALGARPRAILLDEPTAMLDEAATARVEGLIADACQRGAPVIIVTHDRAQAERLGARRFRMEQGRLVPEEEAE